MVVNGLLCGVLFAVVLVCGCVVVMFVAYCLFFVVCCFGICCSLVVVHWLLIDG